MADFQKVETLDCSRYKLNEVTRDGANSLAQFFSTVDGAQSGPHASLHSTLQSTFKTSDYVNNTINVFIFDDGTANDSSVSLLEANLKYLSNIQDILLGSVALRPTFVTIFPRYICCFRSQIRP